eukprot:RCo038836
MATPGKRGRRQGPDVIPESWKSTPVWKLLGVSCFRLRLANALQEAWMTDLERTLQHSDTMDYLIASKWRTLLRRDLFAIIRSAAVRYRTMGQVSGPRVKGYDPTLARALAEHRAILEGPIPASQIDSLMCGPVLEKLKKLWARAHGCADLRIAAELPPLLSQEQFFAFSALVYTYFLPGISKQMARQIAEEMWKVDANSAPVHPSIAAELAGQGSTANAAPSPSCPLPADGLPFVGFTNILADVLCCWCDPQNPKECAEFLGTLEHAVRYPGASVWGASGDSLEDTPRRVPPPGEEYLGKSLQKHRQDALRALPGPAPAGVEGTGSVKSTTAPAAPKETSPKATSGGKLDKPSPRKVTLTVPRKRVARPSSAPARQSFPKQDPAQPQHIEVGFVNASAWATLPSTSSSDSPAPRIVVLGREPSPVPTGDPSADAEEAGGGAPGDDEETAPLVAATRPS